VLIHIPVFQSAKQSDGTYDFSHLFKYCKDIIKDSDYFVANLETTLGGTGRKYSGFPRFNSPDAIVDALKGAGVDCLLTANNHTYDTNGPGVLRTIDIIEDRGLDHTGTRKTTDDIQYLIKKINGIKFGFVNYTYETPTSEGRKALNGLIVDTETAPLINSFKPDKPADFYSELESNMKKMKKKGADVIVVYIHWGEEYQREPNNWQKKLAQRTADMGADVIFASHPHVPQMMEYVTVTDSAKQVPVFYSLGNFVSNQRAEIMNDTRTEEELIGIVNITYKEDAGITDIEMDAVPLWVDKYYDGGDLVYTVIPLDENMGENASLQVSGHMSNAKRALEEINEILGRDSE
jgi:poly-gamma-glutamate synthesis protein (capsule biosynthesis protein)